ncbi:cytochrome P450 [Daldinia bambusicola]|nr:cytochrome P450 [Daldinia bambusicola]
MPAVTTALSGVVATYIFLLYLLHLTQDAREPPVIETEIPFLGPLFGMFREKLRFYPRLIDTYKLPIYTLRMPFSRMYIANATELNPAVQRHWRTISFAAIAAEAGNLVGMSKGGVEVRHQNLQSEDGFSISWLKYIMPAMGPGEDLDSINKKTIEIFSADMEKLRSQGTVAGFLTLSVFPFASLFSPKLVCARELAANAITDSMRKGGHEKAFGPVRKRFEHHRQLFGLSLEDVARGELGNTFAVLGNSTPCSLWVLYHIFSDEEVLADIRREVSNLVREEKDEEKGTINVADLAGIRESCRIFLSTFQETLRYRAVNPGPRVTLEDVILEGWFLLKKGSMLMIPAPVQHSDVATYGENAKAFDHVRFVRKPSPGHKKPNRVAFRAFGGGHVLCPGRHFGSTEIMALAALLVLQFDVVPVAGKWVEPTWENSPVQAGFPILDKDIDVELRPRDTEKKWHVIFTGSDKAVGIVSEDSLPDNSN